MWEMKLFFSSSWLSYIQTNMGFSGMTGIGISCLWWGAISRSPSIHSLYLSVTRRTVCMTLQNLHCTEHIGNMLEFIPLFNEYLKNPSASHFSPTIFCFLTNVQLTIAVSGLFSIDNANGKELRLWRDYAQVFMNIHAESQNDRG